MTTHQRKVAIEQRRDAERRKIVELPPVVVNPPAEVEAAWRNALSAALNLARFLGKECCESCGRKVV